MASVPRPAAVEATPVVQRVARRWPVLLLVLVAGLVFLLAGGALVLATRPELLAAVGLAPGADEPATSRPRPTEDEPAEETATVAPTLVEKTAEPATPVSSPGTLPTLTPFPTVTPEPTLPPPTGAPTDPPVVVFPLTGDGTVQLSFGSESDYTPDLSPDQSRLIFSSEIGSNWQLVEGDANGSEEAFLLTSGPADTQAPHFAPDGRALLVSSDRDGDYDIYLLDSGNGAEIAQLTDMPGTEYFPRWLPDGSGFIFSWLNNDVEAIYLQRLDGGLTELARSTAFEGFAWPSPDGRQVAFYSGRDGDYEIYVLDIDGGNPRRLTVNSGRDASPTWSPDGQWIAFESDRNGDYDLFLIRPDGRDLRQITSGDDNEWFPSFSPDGQWLLFQSDRTGNMDIFRMPFAP